MRWDCGRSCWRAGRGWRSRSCGWCARRWRSSGRSRSRRSWRRAHGDGASHALLRFGVASRDGEVDGRLDAVRADGLRRFPSYVIAVTGTSGAGKTTLVRAVAELLRDAATLFFDDYESSSTYPRDWTAWWRAGGDPDAIKTPRLAED